MDVQNCAGIQAALLLLIPPFLLVRGRCRGTFGCPSPLRQAHFRLGRENRLYSSETTRGSLGRAEVGKVLGALPSFPFGAQRVDVFILVCFSCPQRHLTFKPSSFKELSRPAPLPQEGVARDRLDMVSERGNLSRLSPGIHAAGERLPNSRKSPLLLPLHLPLPRSIPGSPAFLRGLWLRGH